MKARTYATEVQAIIDQALSIREDVLGVAADTFPFDGKATKVAAEVDSFSNVVDICDAIEKLGHALGAEHARYLRQVGAYERKQKRAKRGAK